MFAVCQQPLCNTDCTHGEIDLEFWRVTLEDRSDKAGTTESVVLAAAEFAKLRSTGDECVEAALKLLDLLGCGVVNKTVAGLVGSSEFFVPAVRVWSGQIEDSVADAYPDMSVLT